MESFIKDEYKNIDETAKNRFNYAIKLNILTMLYDAKLIDTEDFLEAKERLKMEYKFYQK